VHASHNKICRARLRIRYNAKVETNAIHDHGSGTRESVFCHVPFKLQEPPAHYRPQLRASRTLVATGKEYKLIRMKLRSFPR